MREISCALPDKTRIKRDRIDRVITYEGENGTRRAVRAMDGAGSVARIAKFVIDQNQRRMPSAPPGMEQFLLMAGIIVFPPHQTN